MTQSVTFRGDSLFPWSSVHGILTEEMCDLCLFPVPQLSRTSWLSPCTPPLRHPLKRLMSWLMSTQMWNVAGMQRWWPSMSAEFPSSRGRIWFLRGDEQFWGRVRRQGLCRRPPLDSFILGLFSAQNIFLLNVPGYAPCGSWEIHTLLH